jgi:hypothetical protein
MPTLSERLSESPMSSGTLAYFRERFRIRMHEFLLREFRRAEEAGLTRTQLATKLGKRPELITRVLAGPSNLTLDRISDFLVGLGGEPGEFQFADLRGLASSTTEPAARPERIAAVLPGPPTSGDRPMDNVQQHPPNVVDFVRARQRRLQPQVATALPIPSEEGYGGRISDGRR